MGLHGTALWVYVIAMAAYLTVAIGFTAPFLWRRARRRFSARPVDVAANPVASSPGLADAIVAVAAGHARLEVVESEVSENATLPPGLTMQRRVVVHRVAPDQPATVTVEVGGQAPPTSPSAR